MLNIDKILNQDRLLRATTGLNRNPFDYLLVSFEIDGVERPINRPQDKEKQKENYSGKKKRHTRKNVAVSAQKKDITVNTDL